MNACNLTAAVTALANTIACGLNAEEISLLSSVPVQLGDTLATIAAHKALCEARLYTLSHQKARKTSPGAGDRHGRGFNH